MPLQPIRFNLANVDINIEAPSNLPALVTALTNNHPFPDSAFVDGAIPLGSIRASARQDFNIGGVTFLKSASVSGGVMAGIGVYRSANRLLDALKVEGMDEPMIGKLNFGDLAHKNLLAIRWGYVVAGSISGSVALGPGINFGASARRESLFAVMRLMDRDNNSVDALTTTVNSWKLPRQVDTPEDLESGTWLIAETDGELKLTLGIEYGYDYSWVREALKLGGLSGDFGLKVEMGVRAAFGFSTSGRYTTVLAREGSDNTLRLQVFKLRQQGWSFAFDASILAQVHQDLMPDTFDEFVKGVFNLNGLQILKDLERWLEPDTSISEMFGSELVDYAKEFVTKVTGFNPETEFDKAIGLLRDLISKWRDLPHETTSLLFGLIGQAIPLDELIEFLKRIVDLTDSDRLKAEILSKVTKANFFQSTVGKWLEAISEQGVLSLLANIDDEKAKLRSVAQKTLDLLTGKDVAQALVNLQQWLEERLGLDKVVSVVTEADFGTMDAWLKKRLSSFLGKTFEFDDLENVKTAINALLSSANKFYQVGLKALTDKYAAEFHYSYQKSTSKTALLDITFNFDPATGNTSIATTQLRKCLAGDFTEILDKQLSGIQINKGVLTHEIKRNTHLEVKLPYFSSVTDHINKSLASAEIVDAENARLWIFNLDAEDSVKKKNSLSKLTVAVDLTREFGVRLFSNESYRYDYSLQFALKKAKREELEEKLNPLIGEYFATEFSGPGKANFSSYLTALDKSLDAQGIVGDNVFGTVLTSFKVSVPGRVLSGWKKAPADKKDPLYMTISRRVQIMLRQLIPSSFIQDIDEYKQIESMYPLLVYSALPPMNKVKVTSSGMLKFTADAIYWDSTNNELRSAIFSQYCGPKLRDTILPNIHRMLSGGTKGYYEPDRAGIMLNMMANSQAKANFNSLIYREREIIEQIVESASDFGKFVRDKEYQSALEHLASFGANITDAFNDNISSIYRGSALRPLGTLIFLEVAKYLDPELDGSIKPHSMLDLYILKSESSFETKSFLSGARPENDELAIHQSLLNVVPTEGG